MGRISECGDRAVFPGARSRWEINTRLATPAEERQGICHRTGDATTLVISGIWVNQEEDWITKQSKKHQIHYIHKDLILVLTVLTLITWVQGCGWHKKDKLSYQRGPFEEFSHEDLIEIDSEYFPSRF